MRDRTPSLLTRGMAPLLALGLALGAVGCSSEATSASENRKPATRQLKHIEDLQKKSAAGGGPAGKSH